MLSVLGYGPARGFRAAPPAFPYAAKPLVLPNLGRFTPGLSAIRGVGPGRVRSGR